MSDSLYVWCQLYFRGEDGQHYQEEHGEPVEIKVLQGDTDIHDLTVKVKEEEELECPLRQILVYRPGTEFNNDTKLSSGMKIAEIPPTSYIHPLMVVAPARPQQRQNVRARVENEPQDDELLSTLRSMQNQMNVMIRSIQNQINVMTEYMKQRENEERTLQMSRVTAKEFRRVMEKITCTVDTPYWDPDENTKRVMTDLDASMPDFQWGTSKEDSPENRALYMAYLRNNISLPDGSKLFDGSETSDLLYANMASIGVKTNGTIDVVMAHNRHQSVEQAVVHMWAGIELKKQHSNDRTRIRRQVILQHLASSYLNRDKPKLTIMTDLGERWHFLWFSKSEKVLMVYEATSKGEANYLISHLRDTGATSAPTDFLNRSSWKEMFPTSRGSSSIWGTAHATSPSLDFMDEEEEQEVIFRAVLERLLPPLELPPQMAQMDSDAEGPPTDIQF